MKDRANAVSTVFTNDRKAVFFYIGLNGRPDIPEVRTWFYCLDAQIQTFLADLCQALCKNAARSYDKRFAGIAMVTILDEGNVNIDDVTTF